MSIELEVTHPTVRGAAVPRVERRSRFFFWMSMVLLILVFGGFAQTFFLRPLFEVPPINGFLYAHGILMTAWYVLLVAQTGLVAAHRTDLHRRLGVAGAVLALTLVVVNVLMVVGLPARVAAGQYSIDLDYETNPEIVHQIVWTDAAMLTTFAVLVAIAIVLRRRPGVHKRLMLLASIAILGPAYGRIANLMPSPELNGLVYLSIFAGLHVGLVIYDARTMPRRFHPATLLVIVAAIVGRIAAEEIRTTDFGRAIVAALEARG